MNRAEYKKARQFYRATGMHLYDSDLIMRRLEKLSVDRLEYRAFYVRHDPNYCYTRIRFFKTRSLP